ncbi:MAG: RhuM family protein [Nitrospirota bacterium]
MENKGEIAIYQSKNGKTSLDVHLEQDTVWLTQKQMGTLFNKGVPTINEHIKNIYKEGELDRSSTIRNFRIVQKEGNRHIERDVEHCNLDTIISVGYRVKSREGTLFRIWATNVLKNHMINGFTVNFKRLKELEDKIENFEKFKFVINKFLINSARRDVLNAVIDEVEGLKKDYKTVLEALKRLDIKKDN